MKVKSGSLKALADLIPMDPTLLIIPNEAKRILERITMSLKEE